MVIRSYIPSKNKMKILLFRGASLGSLKKIDTWGVDVQDEAGVAGQAPLRP